MPGRSNGLLDRWSDTTRRLEYDRRHASQAFEVIVRRTREFSGDRNCVSVATLQE